MYQSKPWATGESSYFGLIRQRFRFQHTRLLGSVFRGVVQCGSSPHIWIPPGLWGVNDETFQP